jgi:hypothetical protein
MPDIFRVPNGAPAGISRRDTLRAMRRQVETPSSYRTTSLVGSPVVTSLLQILCDTVRQKIEETWGETINIKAG